METPTIKTNRKPYPVFCLADLPAKVQADFDYIGEEEMYSPRMVKYKKNWYDLSDIPSTRPGPWNANPPAWLQEWDGYASDSFFSGVLVKYCEGFDSVIMATYYS